MRNSEQVREQGSRRRQSGRALTVVLAFVALGSVFALAYGVAQALASADESVAVATNERGSAESPIRSSKAAPSVADRRTSAGSPTEKVQRAERPVRKDSIALGREADGSGESRALAALRARRAADLAAEARGEWKRGGRVVSGKEANRNSARFSPQSAAANGSAEALPASDAENAADPNANRTPYTPGYVDVLGVIPNSPAHRAGIRKGAKILEYNGQPVRGSLEFEKAWAAPNLPETVPIVYEDRYGNTIDSTIRSGNPKATLSAPYN